MQWPVGLVCALRAVMLTWNLFERRFGGDPSIVGRQIHLDGKPYTVVGVLPNWFAYPDAKMQVWVTYASGMPPAVLQHHDFHFSRVVGRLRPDVSLARSEPGRGLPGYDVVTLVEKSGKSASHIYARLSLLQLIAEVAEAFTQERITASHANLIARLQQESQAEAFEQCWRKDWQDSERRNAAFTGATTQALSGFALAEGLSCISFAMRAAAGVRRKNQLVPLRIPCRDWSD